MPKPRKVIDIFPPKTTAVVPPEKERKTSPKIDFSLEPHESPSPEEEKKRGVAKKMLGLISLFLVLTFLLLHFIFARADIEIWPETKTLNFREKVTVDAKTNKIDFSGKVIPGKIFEDQNDTSQEFSSSGKIIKENYAQGTIRVYNNFQAPQILVEKTRFQPPLEKILYFRATKTITVPVKGYVDVEVKADRPGEEYNIGPSTFSIPGLAGLPQYYSVYGKSSSAMSGGFKGEAKQVTKEDLEKAQKFLSEKIEKEGKDYLRSKIPEDFILLNEAVSQEIINPSSSVAEGGEADSFTFTLKVKSRAILFRKSDIENFAKEFIASSTKNTDKKLQPESLKLDYSVESVNKELDKIVLNLKISAQVYSDVDLGALKKDLAGKSLRETRLSLEGNPQIRSSKINLWPFWIGKVPKNFEKIKIKLNIEPAS